jgi:hypothetical protein
MCCAIGENIGLVCVYSEMHLYKELTADVQTKLARIMKPMPNSTSQGMLERSKIMDVCPKTAI